MSNSGEFWKEIQNDKTLIRHFRPEKISLTQPSFRPPSLPFFTYSFTTNTCRFESAGPRTSEKIPAVKLLTKKTPLTEFF